jgi:glycine/D-amino acid oxidase-like deaminating enzyme/nitrite reductase/ring-hydroxylating ferredoxin subunit
VPNYSNTPWLESTLAHRYPRLEGDFEADVAIVGAGVTGVTAAVLLKRAGLRVALIESRRVGKGETARTTAHLTEELDTRYATLIARFGPEGARLAALGQQAAIKRIAGFVSELDIDCGFAWVPGFLYAEDDAGADGLEEEAEAARSVGLAVEVVDRVPLPFPVRRALRFERQAEIHPRSYLLALAALVPGAGSAVFEETHVVDIDEGPMCRVITGSGVISAHRVIVAAHVPISNRIFLHAKLAAYRTYVIGVPTTLPPELGLYWDTAQPYHYLRTHRVGPQTFLMVGGEDHKVGEESDTTAPFARLEQFLLDHFGIEPAPTDYRWSGQIIEPADGLPYIGRNSASRHVYVATGYSGNGMTGGTLAAIMLADELRGVKSPWRQLLDATRWKPLASARAVVSENKDFPRHLVADRIGIPGAEALASLPRGEGKVVSIDGERYAVYRNAEGHLSARSPVCTHLGCLVHWNSTETSWDCPCHGSRFDPSGRVLNGPAVEALPPRQLPEAPLAEREQRDRDQDEERSGGVVLDFGNRAPA